MRNKSDPDPKLPDYCNPDKIAGPGSTDTYVQLAISLTLGFSAFIAFCVSLTASTQRAFLEKYLSQAAQAS